MSDYYIGLMSGTSLDAIDAVLVDFSHSSNQQVHSLTHQLPESLRQQLLDLTLPGPNEIERQAIAEPAFARESAKAVQQLLSQSGVEAGKIKAIGSHGQTIRHRPEKAFTLQIGDPALIAELTGISVVSDFRRRDIAAGGQGAPLVPAFHQAVFASTEEERVIVNIGGMSNITILPTSGANDVTGFDTGPGNVLMDSWCQLHRDIPYDKDGLWAASESHDKSLLSAMLKEAFFSATPPKSTGRELFNPDWLASQLKGFEHLSPATVQATLCHLTAISIAQAISTYAPQAQKVFVCGGGANNTTLMKTLQGELASLKISTTDSLGIAPDWVEAVAFAWLAKRNIEGLPGNLPAVTGAKGFRMLGAVYTA